MEFFNKKEDVIDLQITQYGRFLMSKGKFKPVYYSFYDDNVIYNGSRAGLTEPQNNCENRIKETPLLQPQIGFSSLEKEFQNNYKAILSNALKAGDPELQRTPEKNYLLPRPIGTGKVDSEYAPAWNVEYLNGSISGSAGHIDLTEKSGGRNTLSIPQINTHMEIKREEISNDESDFHPAASLGSPLASDIIITSDEEDLFVLLKVVESNGLFQKENFDIEMYEVIEEKTNNKIIETLRPLSFSRVFSPENETAFIGETTPRKDKNYAEYYFDILIDDEISDEMLCRYDPENKKRTGVFSDPRTKTCQDIIDKQKRQLHNIYIPEGESAFLNEASNASSTSTSGDSNESEGEGGDC